LVLWASEGVPNQEISARLSWSKPTVGKWRQRFVEHRIAGLYDELRPGRPRSVSDEQVALLLRRTPKQKPPAGTHWTVRPAAESNGLSKSSVHRVFQLFALQPDRRQLRHAQACQGTDMVGITASLSSPLHAHLLLLAQSGRVMVRPHHPTGHPARIFQERQRTHYQNQPIRPTLQQPIQTLRLDRYADSIFQKLSTLCERISGTRH